MNLRHTLEKRELMRLFEDAYERQERRRAQFEPDPAPTHEDMVQLETQMAGWP